MKYTKIYIIDDSLIMRAMMETLVERSAGLEICGLASNAEHALQDMANRRPDVVLLDLAMPGLDGLSFLDRVQHLIHKPWNPLKVIVVSSAAKHGAAICDDAFALGAVACFDKSFLCERSREFVTLLHEVGRGRISRHNHPGKAVTLPAQPDRDFDAAFLEGQFAVLADNGARPDALTFI